MANSQRSPRKAKPSGPPAALVQAVRRLLRPLVRLLLTHGVRYPYLADLLKGIYLDVAERDFRVAGRQQTQSRLSLLTGVHRKDVRRLSEAALESQEIPADVSLGVQIAGLWLSDPDFVDAGGNPRPLERTATAGGEQSFESLVARVSKDIRSRAVLDEWLRLGAVQIGEDGRLRLQARAFVPKKGFDEKVFFLGQNIHDHLAAAAGNVIGDVPPQLERSTFYEGLSPESVEELAELAQERGTNVLLEVNRRAIQLRRRDIARGVTTQRMNFGVYFHHEASAPPEDKDA